MFYPLQVALIIILAQAGSYVPAEEVELGVLDAVFTRYEKKKQGAAFLYYSSITRDMLNAYNKIDEKNTPVILQGTWDVMFLEFSRASTV